MKTNEVKACVTRQLRRLQVLPDIFYYFSKHNSMIINLTP